MRHAFLKKNVRVTKIPMSFKKKKKEGKNHEKVKSLKGENVERRNEKECNKLAVRLFSTCIKTSSSDGRANLATPSPFGLNSYSPYINSLSFFFIYAHIILHIS